MEEELQFLMALSMVPGIGPMTARKLILRTGSAKQVFEEKAQVLQKIPGIGPVLSSRRSGQGFLEKAIKEIEYCRKNEIIILTIDSEEYPRRLRNCVDAPLILYLRGSNCLNASRLISMVGTRGATTYGRDMCRELISGMGEYYPDCVVVSGLAYGIDYHSHADALRAGLQTVAVLGHGLGTIYPSGHKNLAGKITEGGCLCSDFHSKINPERNNFIKRNRIIAGLSDATIIVESGVKGGALITADIADSYNRDVFAFPGRSGDEKSKGCNALIKNNKAGLIENLADLEFYLGWEREKPAGEPKQKCIFENLSAEEERVVTFLKAKDPVPVDTICHQLNQPVSRISVLLTGLECKGIVRIYPGNCYKLI